MSIYEKGNNTRGNTSTRGYARIAHYILLTGSMCERVCSTRGYVGTAHDKNLLSSTQIYEFKSIRVHLVYTVVA